MKVSELKSIIKEEVLKVLHEDLAALPALKPYTGSDLAAKQMLVKKFAAKLQWVGIGAPLTSAGMYFPDYDDMGECVGIFTRGKFYIGAVEKLGLLVKSVGIDSLSTKELKDQLASGNLIGYSIPSTK